MDVEGQVFASLHNITRIASGEEYHVLAHKWQVGVHCATSYDRFCKHTAHNSFLLSFSPIPLVSFLLPSYRPESLVIKDFYYGGQIHRPHSCSRWSNRHWIEFHYHQKGTVFAG